MEFTPAGKLVISERGEHINLSIANWCFCQPETNPLRWAQWRHLEEISGDAVNTIKNNPDIKINDLTLNGVLPTDNLKVANPPILDIEKIIY